MIFWRDQRVVVTGGTGFVGRRLVGRLQALGCAAVTGLGRGDYDLRRAEEAARLYRDTSPTLVIHLAAVVGGIGANRERPAEFFFDNLLMGVHVLDEAWRAGVRKVVNVGTVCAYPKFAPVPFREDDIWNGYPEETNAPYGLAKKALLVQSQAYRQQYGFNSIFLLPTNLYGPGDNFDPRTSHVIPALIRKAIDARDAGKDFIDVWGSGDASREFLFVRDAAQAICRAADCYDKPDPVNIGSGSEIKIRELVELLCDLCAFRGEIRWDPSKPDGQPRRLLDTTRAKEEFGFAASTSLREGLIETIVWYERCRSETTTDQL